MAEETENDIRKRMGLPEIHIPPELKEKVRRQLEERRRYLSDPKVQAALRTHNEAMLARFRRREDLHA